MSFVLYQKRQTNLEQSDPDGVLQGCLTASQNSHRTWEWKEIAAGSHSIPQTTLLDRSLFKIFKYEINLNNTYNLFPTAQ
jgi:hypothetical protein